MSGNERKHEISAPIRHSRTGGNPTPGNVRLRPLADEYCDLWEESVAQDETPPIPRGLFEKLPGKSTLRQYFPAVFNYLNDCRWSPCLPHPNRILGPPRPPCRQSRPGAQALWVRNLRQPRRGACPTPSGPGLLEGLGFHSPLSARLLHQQLSALYSRLDRRRAGAVAAPLSGMLLCAKPQLRANSGATGRDVRAVWMEPQRARTRDCTTFGCGGRRLSRY